MSALQKFEKILDTLTLDLHVGLLFLLSLFLSFKLFLAAHEPLRITVEMRFGQRLVDAFDIGLILPLVELLLITVHVAFVHLAHFLDFVQVNDKASLIRMVFLDALAAKHSVMV